MRSGANLVKFERSRVLQSGPSEWEERFGQAARASWRVSIQGPKRCPGKARRKRFFGSVAVGYDRAGSEAGFQDGPEREEGGRVVKIRGGDSVDLLCGPDDFLIALEKGDKGIVQVFFHGVGGKSDLYWSVGVAFCGAGGLEVDGGENSGGDLDAER